MNIWEVAALVLLLNMPFGYWRSSADKFSRQWFLAVHLPVPFVVALRIASRLGFHFITFPVMIGAFFLGQYAGGLLRGVVKRYFTDQATACLVMDVVSGLRHAGRRGA